VSGKSSEQPPVIRVTTWHAGEVAENGPESAEDYYARIAAATASDGRLPVAVEEMPGWDIFPFEVDSLRMKPLQPLADVEPSRGGEDRATCWCADPDAWPGSGADDVVWADDRWRLKALESGLPVMLVLEPREHCDLTSVPDELAGEMGRLTVSLAAGVEGLPSVGRCHLAKYGDGGAHLHLFFLGRPARTPQLRGSPLLDWEENLPRVPREVALANAAHVVRALVDRRGGAPGPALS
jgi:hypothetical protein